MASRRPGDGDGKRQQPRQRPTIGRQIARQRRGETVAPTEVIDRGRGGSRRSPSEGKQKRRFHSEAGHGPSDRCHGDQRRHLL